MNMDKRYLDNYEHRRDRILSKLTSFNFTQLEQSLRASIMFIDYEIGTGKISGDTLEELANDTKELHDAVLKVVAAVDTIKEFIDKY